MTLAGSRLKASVRFPSVRGMYQRGTCKGCNKSSNDQQVLHIYEYGIVAQITTCGRRSYNINKVFLKAACAREQKLEEGTMWRFLHSWLKRPHNLEDHCKNNTMVIGAMPQCVKAMWC